MLSMEWGLIEIIVPAQVNVPSAQLVISFARAGEVEMDDLTITEKPLAAANTAPAAPNLLTSGSFPAGLARPWGSKWGAPEYAVPDSEVNGPSGLPALRVKQYARGHGYSSPSIFMIAVLFLGTY